MAKKTFNVDVENFEIVAEDYSDDQLAIVEVYVCHDGNNRHNVPISREALVKAKDTLKNKFLVAGFDGVDFEGHEPDEMIVGFFPESSKMRFELRGERTYLVAQAIMSKVYARWAYDIFANGKNHRDVSMEITVLRGEVDEYDNLLTIDEFVFNGVTILGVDHVPACEGSGASIIKFDCENALKVYNEHREDTAVVKFSGKEEVGTMDETKEVVETVEVQEADVKETEVNTETTEILAEAKEEPTEDEKESSKEDNETMYSEDDKDDDSDDESKDDDSDDEDESKEDVEKKVENETDIDPEEAKECKHEVCEKCGKEECVCESENNENLPTENCEAEEPIEETEGETEDFESVKAERDSLLEKCEVLQSKVEKYEAEEKAIKVENILSDVIDLFTADEISELREESNKYSLDELNIFDNEVKAKAFDRVKNHKVENKKFTKVAINDVLDNKQVSKYTW